VTPLVRASAGVLRLRVTGSFAGAGWVAGLLICLNRREFGREVQNSPKLLAPIWREFYRSA